MTEKSGEKSVLKLNRYSYSDWDVALFEAHLVRSGFIWEARRQLMDAVNTGGDEGLLRELGEMVHRLGHVLDKLDKEKYERMDLLAYTYVGEMHEGKEDESDR